jgi:sulfate permease, SulP family
MTSLHSLFPWIKLVNRDSVRGDLIAGLVGGVVVLPQAVAFAHLAGMPAQYGLYCAVLPAILAAIFGSSLHAVSGPTNAVSMMIFALVTPLAVPESERYIALVLTLAFMSGCLMLLLGALRLGRLERWIDHAVVLGFTSAVGVLIAANQLGALTGIPIQRGGGLIQLLTQFLSHLHQAQAPVMMVAAATIGAGVVAKRWLPEVPAMLVAISVGIIAGFAVRSGYPADIKMIGAINGHLPPLSAPLFDFEVWRTLATAAIAITLLSLVEAISIGRAVAMRSGQTIEGNREFVGQGIANIGAAFTSGYPCSASFNRSGLNYESGAKTPLASVFAAITLLLIVIFAGDWARHIPVAATAGLLVLVAWSLLHIDEVRELFALRASTTAQDDAVTGCKAPSRVTFVITFSATLLTNLEAAIAIGIATSVIVRQVRLKRRHSDRSP